MASNSSKRSEQVFVLTKLPDLVLVFLELLVSYSGEGNVKPIMKKTTQRTRSLTRFGVTYWITYWSDPSVSDLLVNLMLITHTCKSSLAGSVAMMIQFGPDMSR